MTAYKATPLSQAAEMPCGELVHEEGREQEEMGWVENVGTAAASLAAEQNDYGVVPQWSTQAK